MNASKLLALALVTIACVAVYLTIAVYRAELSRKPVNTFDGTTGTTLEDRELSASSEDSTEYATDFPLASTKKLFPETMESTLHRVNEFISAKTVDLAEVKAEGIPLKALREPSVPQLFTSATFVAPFSMLGFLLVGYSLSLLFPLFFSTTSNGH